MSSTVRKKSRLTKIHNAYLRGVLKKFRFLIILFFLLTTTLFALRYLIKFGQKIRAVDRFVSASLLPTNIFIPAGQTFTLNILLTTIQASGDDGRISAADLYLRYPSESLTYIPRSLSQQPINNYFTDIIVDEVVDDQNFKLVHLVLVARRANAELVNTIEIRLPFSARRDGRAEIRLLTNRSQVAGIDPASQSVLFTFENEEPATTVTIAGPSCQTDASCGRNAQCQLGYCVCQTSYLNCNGNWADGCEVVGTSCQGERINLRLKLRFQGIVSKPADSDTFLRTKIVVRGSLLSSPKGGYANFTTKNGTVWEGSLPLEGIYPGGGYEILIKGPKHLQRRICSVNPREDESQPYSCDSVADSEKITLIAGDNSFDFSNIYQWAGDLPFDGSNQDRVIDSTDVTFLRNKLLSKIEDDLRSGDLNLNGMIDVQDYALPIAVFNLGKNADEE